jgi:SAM-dependent methyltransferase
MGVNTKHRTQEAEIMDDFLLEGEELRDALDKIASINKLLGGNQLTLEGVKQLLKNIQDNRQIIIADVGCGNGDMLRMLADYGKKENLNFRLIGIDANAFTVNYAKKLSVDYTTIEYLCIDIFKEEFKQLQYDIVLQIISIFNTNARMGVVINDLHRSKMAYRLFNIICKLFSLNRMSREDGLTSILRGFKKEELQAYSQQLNLKNYSIHWKWAFRYQWIISKL